MGEIIKVNSNEVPYEVQDEGGECWTQHETLEEAIKAFHETAKQKRDQNGYTATDEGDGAYLMLALYRGVAGKTCVDDYELHPTAEWSRITQALKERDELAAEIERVKAERDEMSAVIDKLDRHFFELQDDSNIVHDSVERLREILGVKNEL